jgi:TPR repeat protein
MKAHRVILMLLLLLLGNGCNKQSATSGAINTPATNNARTLPDLEIPSAMPKTINQIRAKAENGDAEAQFKLGVKYFRGEDVPQDMNEAIKWFRMAADQGIPEAQFKLGSCYYDGDGVAKDEAEAVKWYRKAAEQNLAVAQNNLGLCYAEGQGVTKDEVEAVKWWRKAAEQNLVEAQFSLGLCYAKGVGVAKNEAEAMKWYRKAGEQNYADAQYNLGVSYHNGDGVAKDEAEAVKWFRKAADQGLADAQIELGKLYAGGLGVPKDDRKAAELFRKAAEQGYAEAQILLGYIYFLGKSVPKDYVEGYKWFTLAAAQGDENARELRDSHEAVMTPEQVAEGQRLAREFRPRKGSDSDNSTSPENPTASGTGFFITDDGYLISNNHVVKDATQVRLVTSAGSIAAKVVRVDAANDLALLKAEGRFAPLPITASRTVKLGGTVATIGFPDPGLQGFSPKLAKGEIASLSGAADDARYFQISVPVQPGNSGGALVDEHGNVVGVVSAKLNASAALAASGALPENVNYAVKSSFLLSFLESVPDVSAKLKAPVTVDRKFEDVVKSAQDAAVLVLVY